MSLQLIRLKTLLEELTSVDNIKENLNEILRLCREMIEFQSMGIFLKNYRNNSYKLKVSIGLSVDYKNNSIINNNTYMWPIVIMDEMKIYNSPEDVHFEYFYKQLVIIPLIYKKEHIGFFFMDKKSHEFTAEEIDLLNVLVSFITLSAKLHNQEKRIDTLLENSSKTELFSYKSFVKYGRQQLALAKRRDFSLTIAVVRLNKYSKCLKKVGFEELKGTLRKLSQIIKIHLRDIDVIGYILSDTYAIMFPETDATETLSTIQRLEEDLNQSDDIYNLRLTWGIEQTNKNTETLESVFAVAEDKAYDASISAEKTIIL